MNKIFVIGSSNTDMVVQTDQLPLPGETRLGGVFFMNAGGKGANQAVAAARLGGDVTLVTKLGNDIFGNNTLLHLKEEQIHTDYVFFDETTASGTALITVDATGENSIVVAPGANANLLPADIKKMDQFGEADIVLMQLEIPMETIKYVSGIAKSKKQKVIINPAPAQKLEDDLLNGLFLLTPNETEAFFLTGIQVLDESSASAAAAVFLDRGVQHVIITMGSRGVFFKNNQFQFSVKAPVVKAVDTTAAGDVFNGAIAVALTEMMDWEQALSFAVRAASISVTRMGAQSSAPYRRELIILED
jgi:ribokinase